MKSRGGFCLAGPLLVLVLLIACVSAVRWWLPSRLTWPETLPQTPSASDPLPLESTYGKHLPWATIQLEDRRFRSHSGLDLRGVVAASVHNMREGRIVRGASTISQQLIKVSTGRLDRSWYAKYTETLLAWRLEERWSKEQILSAYLQRVPYGNGLDGATDAAAAYFRKEAHRLTLPEAIFLAGLPQAPSRLNPWRSPAAAWSKYRLSVELLLKRGELTSPQAQSFLRSPPRLVPPPR